MSINAAFDVFDLYANKVENELEISHSYFFIYQYEKKLRRFTIDVTPTYTSCVLYGCRLKSCRQGQAIRGGRQ